MTAGSAIPIEVSCCDSDFAGSVDGAITFLGTHVSDNEPALLPVARDWLAHAAVHLQNRLDRYLRDGHRRPSTEDEARAVVKGLAEDLAHAAKALHFAAYTLKENGCGVAANKVHLSYLRVQAKAEALQ